MLHKSLYICVNKSLLFATRLNLIGGPGDPLRLGRGENMDQSTPALRVVGLQKAFGGVPVLKSISFEVPTGHVTALAGENGAGKSTVMKIVSGQLKADAGEVFIFEQTLEQGDPGTSRHAGVSIVPQELAPYLDLSVYENLFVGREIHNRLGLLNRSQMIKDSRKMLEIFGLNIDPRTPMNRLSVAVTQLVEITKATSWGAKILLLDEPTSAIPDQEVDQLYSVVRTLRSQGVAMVYTTHRMAEIQEIADSVVVLRDGDLVLNVPILEAQEETIVHAMVGRDLEKVHTEKPRPDSAVRLQVVNLQVDRHSPEVSLEVHAGEILGLGGLIGAGRTEIVEAIFGIRESRAGQIVLDGKEVIRGKPAESIRAGFAFVPEDRKGAGLVLSRSVLDNASLPHLTSFTSGGWIKRDARKSAVEKVVNSVSLHSKSLGQLVGTLSGGNQQKIVLARWLTQEANLLILDEPTRGVDVGARSEIYSIIRSLAASGISVLLVSSDMAELIDLSHRVLVVRAGAIVGELDRDQLDKEDAQVQIFRHASGQSLEFFDTKAS